MNKDSKINDAEKDPKAGDNATTLPFSGEVQVRFSEAPPKPADDKQIHRRRPLPPVAEGDESK